MSILIRERSDARSSFIASPEMPLHGMSRVTVQVYESKNTEFNRAIVTALQPDGTIVQHVLTRARPRPHNPTVFDLFTMTEARSHDEPARGIGFEEAVEQGPALAKAKLQLEHPSQVKGYDLPMERGVPLSKVACPLMGCAQYVQWPGPMWLASFYVPKAGMSPSVRDVRIGAIRVLATLEAMGSEHLLRCMVLWPDALDRRPSHLQRELPGAPAHVDVWFHVIGALLDAGLGIEALGLPITVERTVAY